MFLAGLAVFTCASMACGLAQTQWMLIGARYVQGIGGALTRLYQAAGMVVVAIAVAVTMLRPGD